MPNDAGQTQQAQAQQPQGQAQQQDPQGTGQQAGTQQDPQGQQGGDHGQQQGGPDARIAASKYKEERDAARQQVADLTAQLESLRESTKGLKTAEDVQQAIDDALSKSNSAFEETKRKWERRERELAVSTELAQAGCIDSKAACAHIDLDGVSIGEDGKVEGVDVEGLKRSYPYLFGIRQQAGRTGLPPQGAAEADAALEKARAQFGLKG